MSGSEDESEVLPNSEKYICGGCKNTAVKKVIACEICNTVLHKSCYEKYGCCKRKASQLSTNSNYDSLVKENAELKKKLKQPAGLLLFS